MSDNETYPDPEVFEVDVLEEQRGSLPEDLYKGPRP